MTYMAYALTLCIGVVCATGLINFLNAEGFAAGVLWVVVMISAFMVTPELIIRWTRVE